MNGKLVEQPLAELIREISLKCISGTLRLSHQRAEVVVYLEEGHVVFAASNLRDLRAQEYLKKLGLVSERELASLGKLSDAGLVAALCASGVLDQQKAQSVLITQVADVLRVALLWPEGTWEFDERTRLGDSIRVELDSSGLLMEAARRMELEFSCTRFPNPEELISPVAGPPNNHSLLPAEGFVLSRVDRPTALSELIAVSGLRDLEAYRTIYVLALSGFLHREHCPSVFGLKRTKPKKIDSGKSLAEATLTDEAVPPSKFPLVDEEAELDKFLERLGNATNHYEVLGITAGAGVDQIKHAYYGLARQYHPDRFHMKSSVSRHARIESAFARITQAYEILANSAARSSYDSKLASQERSRKFANSAPKSSSQDAAKKTTEGPGEAKTFQTSLQQAENSFKEGYAALQQGQSSVAVTHLAAAVGVVPQEARYRAYYGRALAAREPTRRQAEAELQLAIKLDPTNTSYRLMLAELYSELGLHLRAKAEVERALTTDPNDASANTLLRRLEVRRQAG